MTEFLTAAGEELTEAGVVVDAERALATVTAGEAPVELMAVLDERYPRTTVGAR